MRPIDANALIEMLQEHAKHQWFGSVEAWMHFCDKVRFAIDYISEAPTLDVQPVRRGEWMAVGDDDQDAGMFFCSRCKDEQWFGKEVHTSTEAARLCHAYKEKRRAEERRNES